MKQGVGNLERLEENLLKRIDDRDRNRKESAVAFGSFFIGIISLVFGLNDALELTSNLQKFFGFSNTVMWTVSIVTCVFIVALTVVLLIMILRFIIKKT